MSWTECIYWTESNITLTGAWSEITTRGISPTAEQRERGRIQEFRSMINDGYSNMNFVISNCDY